MSTELENAVAEEADAAKPTPQTIATLVENHRDFLRFLERRVGSRHAAEDILQDAFVKSADKLEALRNDESAVAWFYRVLRNAAIDYHRRGRRADKALGQFLHELETHEEPAVETRAAVCQCVRKLAATLKPEYAEALERIEVQGVPVKVFAEEAGISSSNAAVRVFRAREALRKQVVKSCGSCAEHGCLNCTCAPDPGGCKSSA
jgi:RNA polymerase sigma-70 factor (ECF subfamily)